MRKEAILERLCSLLCGPETDPITAMELELAFTEVNEEWGVCDPGRVRAEELDALTEIIERSFAPTELPSTAALTEQFGGLCAHLILEICESSTVELNAAIDPRPRLRWMLTTLRFETTIFLP